MSAIKEYWFAFLISINFYLVRSMVDPDSKCSYVPGYSYYYECCTQRWTLPDKGKSLHSTLKEKLYGQHLVSGTVPKLVNTHLQNTAPSKPLVISPHGWTGSGKNFVSRLIAEHIYKEGMNSRFVHQIIATHHFPHKNELQKYKEDLKSWVYGNVTKCERSLFIFDEMDKMHKTLIDVIKPFLEARVHVDRTDFRKSIFIFLSNAGANIINEETFKTWRSGMDREDIPINRMDSLLNGEVFNSDGGLQHSNLIDKHVIGYFIPFLPMERSHVKLCAKTDMNEKGYDSTEKHLINVADELEYFPKQEKVFSTSGCKKVSRKVDFIMGNEKTEL